jgi:DNA-binding MarR family transcriptional regulator
MRADQDEHAREFAEMWNDLVRKWQVELTDAESKKFVLLKTESEKDAFRIIRNFARMAQERKVPDFPVALYNLAERLGLTPPGAGKLLGRFVEGGILKRTAMRSFTDQLHGTHG